MPKAGPGHLPLWWVALITALIPFVALHTTYLVSAIEGYVDWCLPYWQHCASISATGRHGTAYFLFKGAMIPAAVFGALFWLLNGRWLRQLGARGVALSWLKWLGFGACVGLVIYSVVLGHIGDTYHTIRRIGVVLYFALTYIAQLLVSGSLRSVPAWQRQGQRLLWLSQLTLAIGMLSVILQGAAPQLYERIDDAFEWTFALLINLHALWVALLWRQSGYRMQLSVG